jgi:transcriptional regulator with XRE-family HTH domain
MQGYRRLGIKLKLKRVEAGLHQKTLGMLLGGATQAMISWWESGRYFPGYRYLSRINQFLSLDPLALRVYVRATGLQQRRRHERRTKASSEALKMNQRTPFMSGQGPVPNPPAQSSLPDWEVTNGNTGNGK